MQTTINTQRPKARKTYNMSNIEQANSSSVITEAQLFAEFYETDFIECDTDEEDKYKFSVSDLLQPGMGNCAIDFCIDLSEIEDVTDMFESLENDLLGALANLKLANRAWEDFKNERLIKDSSYECRYTVITKEKAAA